VRLHPHRVACQDRPSRGQPGVHRGRELRRRPAAKEPIAS